MQLRCQITRVNWLQNFVFLFLFAQLSMNFYAVCCFPTLNCSTYQLTINCSFVYNTQFISSWVCFLKVSIAALNRITTLNMWRRFDDFCTTKLDALCVDWDMDTPYTIPSLTLSVHHATLSLFLSLPLPFSLSLALPLLLVSRYVCLFSSIFLIVCFNH